MKTGYPDFPCQHVPRAYTDLTVPALPDGQMLDFDATGELFDFYIQWLAGHLKQGDIPIPPEQAPVAAVIEGYEPGSIVLWLSDWLGENYYYRQMIVHHIEAGDSYEKVLASEEAEWNKIRAADPAWDYPYEFFITWRQYYDRVVEEMEIEARLPDLPEHYDIFFRPLLALAVKQCSSRQEAEKHLRRFYSNFADLLSK